MTQRHAPHFPIDTYKLANGLTVVLGEDHDAPIVATNLWYHVGAKDEEPGRTGFAHLFEHMLFEGSAHVGDRAYISAIQRLGGDVNGSTGPDTTNYYETVPSEYLPLALWLESDRMGWLLPAMTQEKLDNQRSVVKNERSWRYDNQPYGLWLESFLELSYPEDFPYRHSVIGSMEHLDRASLDDIERFFKTYYTPRNAVLSVVGDFEPDEAKRWIEAYFGEIPGGPPTPRVQARFSGQAGEKRREFHDPVQAARVLLGYHVPAIGDPEHYAASVLTDVLAAGRSSRLYMEMVYRRQMAQQASSFVYPMELTSALFLDGMAKPEGGHEEIEAALLVEVEKLQQEAPSDREMDRIRNQIASHQYHSLQTVNGRADSLSEAVTYFGDPSRAFSEVDRYIAVTGSDVQQAAQKFLKADNRTVITYIPSGKEA